MQHHVGSRKREMHQLTGMGRIQSFLHNDLRPSRNDFGSEVECSSVTSQL
jgi:hypothetical protein